MLTWDRESLDHKFFGKQGLHTFCWLAWLQENSIKQTALCWEIYGPCGKSAQLAALLSLSHHNSWLPHSFILSSFMSGFGAPRPTHPAPCLPASFHGQPHCQVRLACAHARCPPRNAASSHSPRRCSAIRDPAVPGTMTRDSSQFSMIGNAVPGPWISSSETLLHSCTQFG